MKVQHLNKIASSQWISEILSLAMCYLVATNAEPRPVSGENASTMVEIVNALIVGDRVSINDAFGRSMCEIFAGGIQ